MPRRKPRRPAAVAPEVVSKDDRVRDTVVMFVDIMGASEVSNHKSPRDYADFVEGFQTLFCSICEKYVDTWYVEHKNHVQYSARGDEGLLMIYISQDEVKLTENVDIAINIALELKRQWLCSHENRCRIVKHGLLPIDLGIGIHVGRTLVRKGKKGSGNPGGMKPEGYAINLAKRVEGYSRAGKFSHLFLSESAEGTVNDLPDEITYLFDEPETITPKGISRDIRVYEVKHHFLPTDWKEASEKSERARTLLDPSTVDIATLKEALRINPTNLWLREELIRSSMLVEYDKLPVEKREDEAALKATFALAKELAESMRQSEQRDAGWMFIHGLIEGEYGDYDSERQKYTEAIKYRDQLAQAYWYRGESFSAQLWEETGKKVEKKYPELTAGRRKLADHAIDDLREAGQRRPQCAWMLYGYACELLRWRRNPQETTEGKQKLVNAVHQLEAVRKEARTEPYIDDDIRKDPAIRKLLQGGDKKS